MWQSDSLVIEAVTCRRNNTDSISQTISVSTAGISWDEVSFSANLYDSHIVIQSALDHVIYAP